MELFLDILKFVVGLIIGGVGGFFIARNYMKKYMKQKQVNQMMKSMQKYMD